MTTHDIGGALLPSSSPEVRRPKTGKHGTFETRALPDIDTHGLFYTRAEGKFAGHFSFIASHPNGYMCDELATRIIAAWDGGSVKRALAQLDHVLMCGGLAMQRSAIECIIAGEY